MPPAVAPRFQVRRAPSGRPCSRSPGPGDFHFLERGLDDHFRRELHPGRLQIHFFKRLLREPAQAAVKVTRRAFEKHSADASQWFNSMRSVTAKFEIDRVRLASARLFDLNSPRRDTQLLLSSRGCLKPIRRKRESQNSRPKTPSAFHPHAQRNAFRRDACQQ
jgi:hypothetical protein